MKSLHHAQRTLRQGRFTLVEMIVVTSILFLLLSVFMPHLSKAKRIGHRGNCMYNLHSVDMALSSYELDNSRFPIADPLLTDLTAEGYILDMDDYRCPADKSAGGDTYSLGFLGGHPANIDDDDPVVVCGWHMMYGTLAAFYDHSVEILNDRKGGATIPVTVTSGGDAVGPGFVLHDSKGLTITSADGNEALLYGKDGAYLVSATYDPYANFGNGSFVISVGFDKNTAAGDHDDDHDDHDDDGGEVKVKSETVIEFYARLPYVSVKVRSDPNRKEATIKFDPKDDYDKLEVKDYSQYEVVHRITGQMEEDTYIKGVSDGGPKEEFRITENNLELH